MANEKSVDSVKVRMYRHGFGDCFLLSFYQAENRVFTMLIDCGIKLNTKSEKVPITDVIADLKATLTPPGKKFPVLDVLVATHEHWDHIAYFHPTKFPDFFADFKIGQVWLAWTEDPEDKEAATINSRLRDGAAALQVASMQLAKTEGEEVAKVAGLYMGDQAAKARADFNVSLNNVLGFYGLKSDSGITYKKDGKISVETEVAMTNISDKLSQSGDGVKYFLPGTKVDGRSIPSGVNIYVLGPPKKGMINKSTPSKGASKETYLGIDNSGLTSFVDGLLHLGMDKAGGSPGSQASPFGEGVGIDPEAAKSDPYFKHTYFSPSEKHRTIENNWLDIAGQFALQLDGAINNTSLVLAIELADTGKVLLFPGDAQVGSWMSWHDCEWKVKRGSKTETVTATDLLENTVLYKVSHHGSHNATVKDKGLELMTHPELVAMIPEKENSYSGILYEPLLDRLNELCKGRVLISADAKYPPEKVELNKPKQLSAAEWKEFKSKLVVKELYVEYTIR